MKNRLSIKWIIIYFVATTTLLISCQSVRDDLYDNPYLKRTLLPEEYLAFIEEDLFGFWFTVSLFGQGTVNPTFDPDDLDAYVPFYGHHQIDSPDDMLEAIISNVSAYERGFVLKLFLDYEEISFRVVGEETYKSEFHFSVEGGYEITIPFILDLNLSYIDSVYKLTAAIFVDPHLQAMGNDNELFWHSYANAINFDLSIGLGENVKHIELGSSYNHMPLERSYNIGFMSMHVIAETLSTLDSVWELGLELENQPVVQVAPNEEISFSFVASPFPFTWGSEGDERPKELIVQNYVIVSLLDWQQIDMNGYPYLFVHVEDNEYERITDLGHFTIIAPDEPGFYDFIAILIPNANHRNTEITHSRLDTSMRFTIEVVE